MKTIYILTCFAFCVTVATAQIINVPADKDNIQAAIEAASEGDTVLVAEGLYYENINFNGKAITVASQFILDADTSHISKTIIDGSKSANPDTASVVTMFSGEDTTSVLCGFTITGGSGTFIDSIHSDWSDWVYIGGAGILIYNSGGKIIHNTIEENHLVAGSSVRGNLGAGILAAVNHNHYAIIRNNIIRNNSSKNRGGWGAGVGLHGGGFLVENNTIMNNAMNVAGIAGGGGILLENEFQPGTINKAIIRSNKITGNSAISSNSRDSFGGGLYLSRGYDNAWIQVYNNVISKNYTNGYGGGVGFWQNKVTFFNNTVADNKGNRGGNSLEFDPDINLIMYNNIIWGDDNSKSEYYFYSKKNVHIYSYFNLLKESFEPGDPAISFGNIYSEPHFIADSYELSDSSLAIGRAVDSVMIENKWYYAPERDLADSVRPNEVDPYVDLGAYESDYEEILSKIADLIDLGFYDYKLTPDFHKDTPDYILSVHDTVFSTAALEAIPIDVFADVDINYPIDLVSPNPADRTATITVTSSDNSTQKVYTVLFYRMSSDNTLKSLSVGCYWDLEYNPETYNYQVKLKTDTVPEISYELNDTLSTAVLSRPSDITNPNPLRRTAFIKVTAEDKTFKIYEILFTIDTTCTECCSVGIEDRYELNKIKIYPNPTNTNFTIDMKTIPPAQKIEILSIDGRIVRILDHIPGNEITLGRDNLPSGIYFVKIHSDKTYVSRVIIR